VPVKKVLIANRGEIAVRVIRGCRDLGLATVAVFSDCDRSALHVRLADQAFPLHGNLAAESYLHVEKLLDVARRAGADAVHPGYGFLAENAAFARACGNAGLTFIGPSPEAIALMGSKTAARETAREAGAPLVPGSDGPLPAGATDEAIAGLAGRVGYPLLVKAVAGGGGKGMRAVTEPAGLAAAVRAARSEAGSAFGDSAVYFERQIVRPRHVEVQLLGDRHGTFVPFVERECSIQRRHQKVVEESPSVAVTPELRQRMADAAARIARHAGYTNAGTIEFLLDADGAFYFLEMNTRLQVEHPVTEMVTGVDLVEWQLRLARGERLTIDPGRALTPTGHAIECRVYAEDPDNQFMPSPGRVTAIRPPTGPGIRDDSGVTDGFEVPIFYDSMISKLIAWGEHRAQAITRLRRALDEYDLRGIRSTIPFFRWLLDEEAFLSGAFDTTYLDRILAERRGRSFAPIDEEVEETAVLAAALAAYSRSARTIAGASLGGRRARSAWKDAGRPGWAG
jgi:acetyl-CoA carboxylase biotin carboxylase subunit